MALTSLLILHGLLQGIRPMTFVTFADAATTGSAITAMPTTRKLWDRELCRVQRLCGVKTMTRFSVSTDI